MEADLSAGPTPLTASPASAFYSPHPVKSPRALERERLNAGYTPAEEMRNSFAVAELECEIEQLRRKAAIQEESLNKYRTEAELLISGGGAGSESNANGMMKAWLRGLNHSCICNMSTWTS